MRRIIILCLCLVLLLGLACSANAVAYGWEDFAIAWGDDRNGNPYAECLFPSSLGRINIYNGNTLLEGVSGGSATRSWTSGQVPRFRYLPFGQQGTSAVGVGKLALKWQEGGRYGIPNGTHLYFDLQITGSGSSLSNATINSTIVFYDEQQNYLTETQIDLKPNGSLPYIFYFDYIVDAPIEAYYMAILIDIRSNVALTSSTSIGIYCSDLWMRGEGLVYNDWKVSGKDIEDIKDGIYDKFDPINPDDIGPDNLPDLEQGGRDNFAGSIDTANGFFTHVLDGLTNFTQGFLIVSALMGACLDIVAIKWLAYLSASVGFIALILAIPPMLVSYQDRQEERRVRALRQVYRDYERARQKAYSFRRGKGK